MSTHSERLEQLRLHMGMTKVDFTSNLGVPQQTYTKYSKGRIPNAEFMTKIISTYGVNCHWLMTGEGEMFPETTSEESRPEYEEENQALKSEIEELKQTIENLKTNTLPPDAELLANLQKVTMEVVKLSEEKRKLQEQLANISTGGETTNQNDGELGKQLAKLMKEHEQLQEEYFELRETLAEYRVTFLSLAGDEAQNYIVSQIDKGLLDSPKANSKGRNEK